MKRILILCFCVFAPMGAAGALWAWGRPSPARPQSRLLSGAELERYFAAMGAEDAREVKRELIKP